VAVALAALVFCFSITVRDGVAPAVTDECFRYTRMRPLMMERSVE
jgi:hypothetical protein